MGLFRHRAGFGKRIEFWLVGQMMKEGLDVYLPVVDDMGIDAVIRKQDGTFIEVQIKARSKDVAFGDAALFSAIQTEIRKNYFFVFYSERMDMKWIMSSEEFLKECYTNKEGKNKGRHSIWLNGRNTKKNEEHPLPKFEGYSVANFDRFQG